MTPLVLAALLALGDAPVRALSDARVTELAVARLELDRIAAETRAAFEREHATEIAALTGAAPAAPTPTRNPAVVRAFRAENPCPSTGKTTGACPGWVIDHGLPICALGAVADDVRNLHWQKVEDANWKDGLERDLCARLRKCGSAP